MRKANFAGCLTATVDMRVPFHDVDPANVVWHGRYFKYFEEARRALFEGIGYGYGEMLDTGFIWPVVDASVRFIGPLVVNQRFKVTAALREWELRVVVDYRIDDLDGNELTRGRTVQVPLDAKTMELYVGTPDILREKIEQALAAQE